MTITVCMRQAPPRDVQGGAQGDGEARAPQAAAAAAKPAPEPSPSDHELIRRAQRGVEEAFEQLVRRHQARTLRVARNMLPADEDAQDLVQEAFLRVFKSLDRFDFEHEFSTWLYRIVTNLAIDHLRRRRPTWSTAGATGADEPESEFDIPDPSASSPERRLDAQETSQRVRACIESLAPHFQAVLVLRELEGLPCTEIARIVGATHVTVRWRLHRGRKLFQEEWERRERLAARTGGLLETNNGSARSVQGDTPESSGAEESKQGMP
jgi:RNA polymerase sigma-70 factor, ECF subfamily